MTKYNEQFKLSVVQQYLSGTTGTGALSELHGIDASMLRRWLSVYRLHGASGLAKKFSYYNAEFKLGVLRHMWDNHLSYREASAVFDIRNPGSISHWERCYHK